MINLEKEQKFKNKKLINSSKQGPDQLFSDYIDQNLLLVKEHLSTIKNNGHILRGSEKIDFPKYLKSKEKYLINNKEMLDRVYEYNRTHEDYINEINKMAKEMGIA